MTLLCAVALALTASAEAARAQDASVDRSGTLRGSVREAGSHRPVVAAMIHLAPAGDQAGDSIVTESDHAGEYFLEDLEPGPYRLRVSRIGYEPAEIWIEMPSGWNVRRSLGLAPAPVELPPIDIRLAAGAQGTRPITGDRVASGVGATRGAVDGSAGLTLDAWTLSPTDLPGVPLMAEPDLLRGLQRLPGVSTRGDFSASVWTRGTPWGLTQILLDGFPLYDPLHLGGIATGISADGLSRITMMPGVRPPSMAQGVAGTLDLHNARAGARAASLSLSPMAIRAGAEGRLLDERIGLSVAGRRSWWDIVNPPSVFTGEGSRGGVGYYFADVSARADARVSDRVLLDAGAFLEEDRLNGDIGDLVAASTGRWGNRLLWGSATSTLGGAVVRGTVGTARYRTRTHPMPWAAFRTEEGIPTVEVVETDLEHTAVKLRADGRLGAVSWGAGAETVRESLLQAGPDAFDRDVPGVGHPARLDRHALWGEASMRVREGLDLSAGLGWDLAPGVDNVGARPSLRVAWRALERLTLEAATGVSRQFAFPLAPAGVTLGPALGAGHLWILANEDSPALAARHTTVSARLRLLDPVVLDVTAWRRSIDGFDLDGVSTLFDGGVHPSAPDGGHGRERGRGLETTLSGSWPRWGATLSYSVADAEFYGELARAWPSPAQRTHSLEAITTFTPLERLRGGLAATVESGWPLVRGPAIPCSDNPRCVDLPEGHTGADSFSYERAPAFASLDLFAAWEQVTGGVRWTVTGSVRNLLGRDNAAAFRAGTCVGAALLSPACEQLEGAARFSPGLRRPAPSLALQVRF